MKGMLLLTVLSMKEHLITTRNICLSEVCPKRSRNTKRITTPSLFVLFNRPLLNPIITIWVSIISRARFLKHVLYIRISVRSLQRRIKNSNIRISSMAVELLNLRGLSNGFVLQVLQVRTIVLNKLCYR